MATHILDAGGGGYGYFWFGGARYVASKEAGS